jgi:hypothetical protein
MLHRSCFGVKGDNQTVLSNIGVALSRQQIGARLQYVSDSPCAVAAAPKPYQHARPRAQRPCSLQHRPVFLLQLQLQAPSIAKSTVNRCPQTCADTVHTGQLVDLFEQL